MARKKDKQSQKDKKALKAQAAQIVRPDAESPAAPSRKSQSQSQSPKG